MVRGVLIKPDGTVQYREVRDELEEWYTLLGCRVTSTYSITHGDDIYCVIHDDEGRLNGNDTPSILGRRCEDGGREVMFVGAVFICKTNGDELASLDTDEATSIIQSVKYVLHDGSSIPVMVDAEW